MANENDMEWFTPGKSCKKCDTKPFSGFELLHFYESVFPLIRESISEAIKRKLSNRDYKMEKMRVSFAILCVYISLFNLQIPSLVYINVHEYYLTPSSFPGSFLLKR
jgi:hypothetical protein